MSLSWYGRAADEVETCLKEHGGGSPLVVGVVGICGSGKSTGSSKLVEELSKRKIVAVVVPMDGFHIPMEKLREMGAEAVCELVLPSSFIFPVYTLTYNTP